MKRFLSSLAVYATFALAVCFVAAPISVLPAAAGFDAALWKGHIPPVMPSALQIAHTQKCNATFIPTAGVSADWCVHGGGDGPTGPNCRQTPDPCDCRKPDA